MSRRAPVLVLAVGNPSRGDDAIGPALAGRLEALAMPQIEVITDYQLQVEHALEIEGRERVIFVDAGAGTPAPFELRRVGPSTGFAHTTHALAPAGVLDTYERVIGALTADAWLLCVRGDAFELGEGLTGAAEANGDAAFVQLVELCRLAGR
ncbi:MAG: hydrogenase maturation protease [Steroidobacteraceae bacterium]|nr:hydrogenase maturation protease [Steroidobacteraceae bacterium]